MELDENKKVQTSNNQIFMTFNADKYCTLQKRTCKNKNFGFYEEI